MKRFLSMLVLMFTSIYFSSAFAQAPTATLAKPTVSQVQTDLLQRMETDGFLSKKLADEARSRYVVKADQQVAPSVNNSSTQKEGANEYLTWANFVKVVAIGFMLIFAHGLISNLIKGVWHLLVQIPAYCYQIPLLAISSTATLMPQLVWPSQAVYVALLASITNLLVIGWVVAIYPQVLKAFTHLFKLGLPVASVINAVLVVYFGGLALHYNSALFGFFAAVALSGVFTFSLYYAPGVLTLYFKENALGALVFGHLILLGGYAFAKISGHLPVEATLFEIGLEYYCTIALGVALLCGSSPFGKKDGATGLYALLMVLVVGLASSAYFLTPLHVVGVIMIIFFILFILEWIAYLGFQGGVVVGCLVLGVCLYAVGMGIEAYGKTLINALV